MPTRIKICGLTNVEDARWAAQCGADYLGFILFAESPRCVTPDAIQTILAELRSAGHTTPAVGVFVNLDVSEIRKILQQTGLTYAQVHGDEGPDVIKALAPLAYKAIRPMQSAHALQLAAQFHTTTQDGGPGLLVDSYDPGLYGGTGKLADQQVAVQLATTYTNVLLSGGLKPENVGSAVTQIRPWGVDVSSGVEAAPGQKEYQAVKRFIDVVRHADERAGS